jgi:hypothetical protein
MEFIKKMKKIQFTVIVTVLLFLACSCMTPAVQAPAAQDPLVLMEIAPLPRAVVAAQQAVTEYEPVYAVYRIIEVTEVNGVQKFFLVRFGADRAGIEVGVTGEIGEDASFQRIIGNYKIVELLGNFFSCEITELAYRIGTNAHARVVIGEKVKE